MSEDNSPEVESSELEAAAAEEDAVKKSEPADIPEPKLEEVSPVPPVPAPAPVPTPATVQQPKKKSKPEPAESNVPEVEVVVDALKFQAYSRKSISVAAVQDRLAELGHGSVRRDPYGWLSNGTVEAIEGFQKDSGLEVTGEADRKTVEALMRGTRAKVV